MDKSLRGFLTHTVRRGTGRGTIMQRVGKCEINCYGTPTRPSYKNSKQEAALAQERPRDAASCTFRYLSNFTTASRGFSATARLSGIVLHQRPSNAEITHSTLIFT